MHRLLRTAARLYLRAADLVPTTWRGTAVAAACALALGRWGLGAMDLVVFVFGIAGLVLWGLSQLVIGGSAIVLKRRLASADIPETPALEAGTAMPTGFEVPALAKVPLVKIDWRWISPEGVDAHGALRGGHLREEALAHRRCRVQGIRRRITVQGAFGLSRVSFHHDTEGELKVLPQIGQLASMPVVQSMAASEGIPHPSGRPEGDRMEIRPYVPGDSPRHILWKTYARTRQLNVRTPERSVERAQRTIAYLLTGEADEAAAAASRVALEKGLLGTRWVFGADGTAEPTEALPAALDAIAASGSFERGADAGATDGLEAFLRRPELAGESHCVVFAPANGGPWIDDALAAGRSGGRTVSFVLGTDGVLPHVDRPLWHRLLFDNPAQPSTTTSEELQHVLDRFQSARCPALVVDRSSGRSHGRLTSTWGGPARAAV
ncbi:MAG: DUF58 domain-containing protein [Acidobacteriota bacterium]